MKDLQIPVIRKLIAVRTIAWNLAIERFDSTLLVATISGDDIAIANAFSKEINRLRVKLDEAAKDVNSPNLTRMQEGLTRMMELNVAIRRYETAYKDLGELIELMKTKIYLVGLESKPTLDLVAIVEEYDEEKQRRDA